MTDKVFIASTVRGLGIAEKIQVELSTHYTCRLWRVDTFSPSESSLESLINETKTSPFAIIIMTADDEIRRKKSEKSNVKIPRDNLIFEAGLFMSCLGRHRVVICTENPPGVKMPTDLSGINTIEFAIPDDTSSLNFQHVVAGMAQKITRKFAEAPSLPVEEREINPRIKEGALDFGDSRHTDIIIDSAFQPSNRRELRAEIRRLVRSKRILPTKLFYVTEEGASAWIELTHDPGYIFFRASVSFFRQHSGVIAEQVAKYIDGAPDVISLGSGDGQKDALILAEIVGRLGSRLIVGKVNYFPLDYSYYLITEVVKNIAASLESASYRIKPIVGDIIDLSSFNYVYERYPNSNLFLLLGNTLGNNDEKEIIDALRSSVLTGDMILIEVNTNTEDVRRSRNSDFVFGRKNMRHNFAPLSIIGCEFAEDRFAWEVRSNQSASPNAISVETMYKSGDSELGTIRVAINHRYQFSAFCEWVAETITCDVVWSHEDGSVGLVLLLRR